MSDSTAVHITGLKNSIGREVVLSGWLYQSRFSGKFLKVIVKVRIDD
jgi:hypothetical protein